MAPAAERMVGSQSVTWMRAEEEEPGELSMLPWMKAAPLVPPSHSVALLPRRGKLLPPLSVCPPLSVVKMIRVFFSCPDFLRAAVMFPTASSRAVTIPQ